MVEENKNKIDELDVDKKDEDKEDEEKGADEKDGDFSLNFNLSPRTKKLLALVVIIVLVVFGGMYYYKNSSSVDDSDPVVALVNGEQLFLSQLDEAYMNINLNSENELSKEEILDMLVDQILLKQIIKAMDINVNEGELEEYITKTLEEADVPEDVFYSRAEENGLTKFEVNQMFKDKYLTEKFYEDQINPRIEITDEIKQEFYSANKNMFLLPDAVNVSHILVETEEEALEVKAQLDSGDSFASLAGVSIDPSAIENNGNIGYIVKGQTVPAFEITAFSLDKGDISDPVKTDFGYHVIGVNSVEPSRHLTFEETDEIISQLLFNKQKQELIQQALDAVEEQSTVEIYLEVLED